MKIKKFISLLAAAAMTLTAITGAMTVSASEVANGTCGDGITWTLDSDGVLTLSGEGKMASPEIPETSYNFPVGDYSDIYSYKEYKEDIKEVVIQKGVTSIGFCAFYQFPNLETAVLPSTITEFESAHYDTAVGGNPKNFAFAQCTKLKNLTLTEGMTALGGRAFEGCTSLESIRIPSTLSDILNWGSANFSGDGWGLETFLNCTSLKNIILPEGLTVISGRAFQNTAVESIVIPSTIRVWSEFGQEHTEAKVNAAFSDCEKLSSVTFTEGLKSIKFMPFADCPLLKKVIIPASVTNIAYGFSRLGTASSSISYFEEIAFEDGSQLTEIGANAFSQCKRLKSLEIPENVTTINQSAFDGCTAENVYLYSRTVDTYKIPTNATVFCYSDAVAKGQRLCLDIENAINNALNDLKTAVKEAEKYAEADYTTESYGALKTALENAKKYDENSTGVLPIEWAADDIMTAIEGLRDKSEEPSSSDPSSSDPSDSSNPTDNTSDPSNSSGNNNQSQSPNTPATPPTAAPTTAVPKPTTPPTVTATTAKPAKVKAVKVKAKKKKLNVSWKKVSGATGYEVLSATNNKFTKNKKSVTVKKNKVTLKKLKSKKKYFVKVRAYKLANGRKYFGKWSKVVKKKTK